MQLKGQVLGYDDIATFELSDVIGSYKEDDVLYIQTSFGETPIVYSTIEPVLPTQRDLSPPEESVAKSWREEVQRKQEREQNRLDANDFALRMRASEEMACTCDACLDIIRDILRKEIEYEKSGPSPIGPPNRAI